MMMMVMIVVLLSWLLRNMILYPVIVCFLLGQCECRELHGSNTIHDPTHPSLKDTHGWAGISFLCGPNSPKKNIVNRQRAHPIHTETSSDSDEVVRQIFWRGTVNSAVISAMEQFLTTYGQIHWTKRTNMFPTVNNSTNPNATTLQCTSTTNFQNLSGPMDVLDPWPLYRRSDYHRTEMMQQPLKHPMWHVCVEVCMNEFMFVHRCVFHVHVDVYVYTIHIIYIILH